jgi:hypothetical protein
VDSTIAGVADVFIAGQSAAGKYRWWIGSTRMPSLAESEATYQASLVAAFSSHASSMGVGVVCAGSAEVTSGVTGTPDRRPCALVVAPKAVSVSEEVNIAQIDMPGGPLIGTTLSDSFGNVKHHDEFLNPGLDAARFLSLRTWAGQGGVYINQTTTRAAAGSDFSIIPFIRVYALFNAVLYNYFLHRLHRGIRVRASTGFILESDAKELEAGAQVALSSILTGKASSWGVTISRTDTLLVMGTPLTGSANLVTLGYPNQIIITTGLSNPATAIVRV